MRVFKETSFEQTEFKRPALTEKRKNMETISLEKKKANESRHLVKGYTYKHLAVCFDSDGCIWGSASRDDAWDACSVAYSVARDYIEAWRKETGRSYAEGAEIVDSLTTAVPPTDQDVSCWISDFWRERR
jgi:hypothetical protein